MVEKKTTRELIMSGEFRLASEPFYVPFGKEPILNNTKSEKQKQLENLKSYQAWFSDRCNSGKRITYVNKEGKTILADEVIQRKNYLYSWHFVKNTFCQSSATEMERMLNEKSFKIQTTQDASDSEYLYFVNAKIQMILDQRNSNYKKNQKILN